MALYCVLKKFEELDIKTGRLDGPKLQLPLVERPGSALRRRQNVQRLRQRQRPASVTGVRHTTTRTISKRRDARQRTRPASAMSSRLRSGGGLTTSLETDAFRKHQLTTGTKQTNQYSRKFYFLRSVKHAMFSINTEIE